MPWRVNSNSITIHINLYEAITFSQALSDTELYGIIEDEMASFAGSDDGFTIKKRCKFFIFLNDRQPNNRIRFTVAHELGHIESGHLDTINCLGLTMIAHYDNDSQNSIFENEANSFARNLLVPLSETIDYLLKCSFYFISLNGFPAVIHNQDPKTNTESYLSRHFGIAKDVARIRLQMMSYDCRIYSMLHG